MSARGDGAGVLDRLPRSASVLVRDALQLVPQLDQVSAMFRAVVTPSAPPAMTPFVLVASPIIYFALASMRLSRMQPAGRLTQ